MIKRNITVVIIFAVMVGVFTYSDSSRGEDATAKVTKSELVSAKEIYGVKCRLLPDKDKWQASEIPKLKAYIPGSGNEDLWLATIVQQGCRIQVDGQWYHYIGPEWVGGFGSYDQTQWLANVGGYLTISLHKNYWQAVKGHTSFDLMPGEHTISLGWAGYKADPPSKSGHEEDENPILLVSKPVRIQIIESEEPTPDIAQDEERHRQVMELFDIFLKKEPLTEAEVKLGIRTNLRSFHYWRPKFKWEDIPVLLELAQNEELVNEMPKLVSSSYRGGPCRKGMIVLWFIEGLRWEQLSLTREKQLGEKYHPVSFRLPLNPICVKEGMGIGECESSSEIHRAVLQAYLRWWNLVESIPAGKAAAFNPLDLTDMQWYGAGDRWRNQPLEIYEEVSSAGIAAERIVRQWKYDGDEYQPDKILQTVYYTLKNPGEKPPFTSGMLKIQKIKLYYYDNQGEEIRTVHIMPASIGS